MSVKTFAAIDIGSFELTMKIFEFSGKNTIREIDCITKRLDLGSGTYATGKISNEKLDELCRCLNEFKNVMKTYRVEAWKAYATSAIRETENATIVQDQIAQRTGFNIRILSNSEQRFLDYKSIAAKGETFKKIIEETTAILDIGGGSIQISLFENDTLVSTQNLKLGVLRLQEMMGHLNLGSEQLGEMMDEYASAQLSAYKKMYLKDKEIKNVILVDDYISPWSLRRSVVENKSYVEAKDLNELWELLNTKNKQQCAMYLGISEEKVSLVEISAMLVQRIGRMFGATKLWAPGVTLCDGMAYEYGEENKLFNEEHDFEKDIIACALNLSKKYMGSRKRSETLESISSTIFDSMKKIHGLGKREKLYLQLASILHDCGKFISLVNIGETSYDIIMATEIIGLSHTEREIVANVVRFNHSPFLYYGYRMEEKQGGLLDTKSYLIVAKLTAILRLANSLDRSHKQKFSGIKATLADNQLLLTSTTKEDISLEKKFFEMNSDFFREVYSIEPVLKTRKSV